MDGTSAFSTSIPCTYLVIYTDTCDMGYHLGSSTLSIKLERTALIHRVRLRLVHDDLLRQLHQLFRQLHIL